MKLIEKGKPFRANRPVVLYVEDELLNFRVADEILRANYELVHVRSDRELCTHLQLQGTRVYAILMDIQLVGSELDGIQLARMIRGTLDEKELPDFASRVPTFPDVPILFLTAYGSIYSETVLVNAGGNRLLNKPVDAAQLELALASIHLQNAERSPK